MAARRCQVLLLFWKFLNLDVLNLSFILLLRKTEFVWVTSNSNIVKSKLNQFSSILNTKFLLQWMSKYWYVLDIQKPFLSKWKKDEILHIRVICIRVSIRPIFWMSTFEWLWLFLIICTAYNRHGSWFTIAPINKELCFAVIATR